MKPQALLSALVLAAIATSAYFLFFSGRDVMPSEPPVNAASDDGGSRDRGESSAALADYPPPSPASVEGLGSGLGRTVAPGVGLDDGSEQVHFLRGRVVDRAGGPRAGVVVSITTWRGWDGLELIRTQPDGFEGSKEEVTTGPDGRFEVRTAEKRSGRLAVVDSELVFAESHEFEATQDDLDLGDLVAVRAARLTGVVRDEAGQPVVGVKVDAGLGVLGFATESSSVTSDDGTFSIGKLRQGAWIVTTKSGRYLPAIKKVEVESEQQVTGLVLVVKPGRMIAGRVLDDRGVGVAGMKVASQRKQVLGGMDIQRFTADEAVVTDERGDFKLAGLEGKTATIRATGKGHTKVTMSNVQTNTANVELRVDRLATVSGVVVAADNTPVAGTRVSARTGQASGGAMEFTEAMVDLDFPGAGPFTKTDAQGRFVLEGVTPGVVTMKARGETHLPSQRGGLRVAPAQQVSGVRLTVDAGAVAHITVVDDAGQPVSGATVSARKAPKPPTPGIRMNMRADFNDDGNSIDLVHRVLGTAETDQNGVATVMGLPAGAAQLRVGHSHYAPLDDESFMVPAAGSVDRRVVMQAPSFIDVVVTSSDGEVLAGTDVLLEVAGGKTSEAQMMGFGDPGPLAKKSSNAEGKLRFGPLAAGRYVVSLSRGAKLADLGEMTVFVGGGDDKISSSVRQVSVASGEAVSVEMLFPILARIVGAVTDSEGPVAGCLVELAGVEDVASIAGLGGNKARTDAQGHFAFDSVESGKYVVRYGKPGQVVKAKHDLEVPPSSRDVRCDLALRTGSVRVLVLSSEDAEPVERASVRLFRAGDSGGAAKKPRAQRVVMIGITSDGDSGETSSMTFGAERVMTDDDGVAVFEDVPVGQFTLEVESGRYAPGKKSDVLVVEHQVTDCGAIELERGGQIRGRVTDANGKPAMALVERRLAGAEGWGDVEMAMQGGYRLTGLVPGRYEVRARAIGAGSGSDPSEPELVVVVAGKTAVLNIELE